jgi:acyl-CoA synthetase (AMP-forming)/AMP-acid ligase II
MAGSIPGMSAGSARTGCCGSPALRGLLDGYKVPKSVIVLDELPKMSTGKIQKNVLRDTHAAHYQS